MRSAAGADDLPRDPAPQIAFVGRSNVGKSTLINALAGQRVARTSAAAGKTRLLNIYRVTWTRGGRPTRLYLVDLPGYGYARGGQASAETFDRLTAEYFGCRPDGRQPIHRGARGPSAALLVVDSRHPGLPRDVKAAEWLAARDLPWAIVASKVDKLNRAERLRVQAAWSKTWNAPVTPVSAVTGEGLEALWKQMFDLLKGGHSRPAPKAPPWISPR